MLPIADLKRMILRDVDPGTLVLYRYGRDWLRGIKVVESGEDDDRNHALIVMPLRDPKGVIAPVLFREIGHEWCIVLGKAVAWWSGDPSAIVPGVEIERRPGYLQLRPDGLTLMVEVPHAYPSSQAWRITDGNVSRFASEYPLITEWSLGITDSEGKPIPFVRYPGDFALGAESSR